MSVYCRIMQCLIIIHQNDFQCRVILGSKLSMNLTSAERAQYISANWLPLGAQYISLIWPLLGAQYISAIWPPLGAQYISAIWPPLGAQSISLIWPHPFLIKYAFFHSLRPRKPHKTWNQLITNFRTFSDFLEFSNARSSKMKRTISNIKYALNRRNFKEFRSFVLFKIAQFYSE